MRFTAAPSIVYRAFNTVCWVLSLILKQTLKMASLCLIGTSMSFTAAEESDQMRQVFDLFDAEGTDKASLDDFPLMLKALGLGTEIISYAEVLELQQLLDPGNSGIFDYETFKRVVIRATHVAESPEEQFRAFRLFDVDRKGYVGVKDLIRVANVECHGLLSESQCRFITERLSTGLHRGGITFEEWRQALSKSSLLKAVK